MEPNDELKIKILAYLDGNLDERQKQELVGALGREGVDASDLENFAVMLHKIEGRAAPQPSKELDTRFYTMLRHEERRLLDRSSMRWFAALDGFVQELFWKRFGLVAATLLFLSVCAFMVYQNNTYHKEIAKLTGEINGVQTMLVITLLEKESAVDRLRAVSLTASLPRDNDAVVHALLTTLNNDPDVNVRLEAIDALLKRAGDPQVRRGLVGSISGQTSPIVQVTLADAMVALQERSSRPELQKLLEEKDTNVAVKAKLKQSLEVLM